VLAAFNREGSEMLEADLALACRFFEFFSRLSCPPTFGRKAVLLLGDAIDKAGAGFKSLKIRGQIPPRLMAG
jgi:hypothetical protein